MRGRKSFRLRTLAASSPGNEWYIAQIVEYVRVAGDRRSVVHVNYLLIEAPNAEEAHRKACAIGEVSEAKYKNPAGALVSIEFLGVRELSRVAESIGDGTELLFTEHVGMSPREARRLVRPRKALSVFRPNAVLAEHPDYSSAEILAEAQRRAGKRSTRRLRGSPRKRKKPRPAQRKVG